MEVKNEKKRRSGLIAILIGAAAVVLLGVGAAILVPKLIQSNNPGGTDPSGEGDAGDKYEGDLYWNVDRLLYAGKSETGMSSRTASKEDGYYHLTFAVNGRQVERRCADKRIVNLIDRQDLMGLLFDESGIISGLVPISDIVDQFSVNGLYVKEVLGDGEFELNSSSTLEGRTPFFVNLTGYTVYDVSGLGENFVGLQISLSELTKYDRLFGVERKDGSRLLFVTDRYVDTPIYWNVERKYNSDIKSTTREPEENGDYVFILAVNGEQKEFRTRSRGVASSIDGNAAKCVALEFSEDGYISRVKGAASTMKGSVWGSWTHVTSLIENQIKSVKNSGSDEGKEWEGELADDVKIFDVSPTAEFVGVRVNDLRVTDQVHCLTDATGQIKIVFIVNRIIDVPVYWNQVRKYSSKTAETTRVPDANGWYVFDMCVNGGPVTVRTKDKAIATKVDSMAARCMGLILDGDVIQKVVSASSLTSTGKGTAASWHHVMSIQDATHFHAKKTVKTASDYGHEVDLEMTPDCQIYNVNNHYSVQIGERTTLRVGDQIHCLTNLEGKVSVIFIVSRPIAPPIYWNVTRKYNSTAKSTTREVETDGYYHFLMAADGKQVELRTKDKAIADAVDAKAARCMGLQVNGDIITKVYATSAVAGATGGTAASWSDVTAIKSATTFHTRKNTLNASNYGQEVDVVMAPGCKVYNVGGMYTYSGEPTTVRVGDTVHCLLNNEGLATTVFVVVRKAPDRTAYCPDCGKQVKWTGFAGSFSGAKGVAHYYLGGHTSISGQVNVPEGVTVHFDMNGHNLICPAANRGITPWLAGSKLVIMNQDKAKQSAIVGGKGTPTGNNGALMWVRFADCSLTIRDITIDGSAVDQTETAGVLYVSAGELKLKNVKLIGAKTAKNSSGLYLAGGSTVLEDVRIEGGTATANGSVYLASAATLTLGGDTRISGGKLSGGETANLRLASGATVAIAAGGITSPDGSIGIQMASRGVFTNAGVGAYQNKFKPDSEIDTVKVTESGALELDFEITGLGMKESKITIPAGTTFIPTPVFTPASKSGVTVSYVSADSSYVEVTEDGEIFAVRNSEGQAIRVAAEASTGHTAEFFVTVTDTPDDAHYHVEGVHADILSENGTKRIYEPWTSTTMFPTSSGYYYLTADVIITNSKQPMIPAGQNVHICLNGHKIVNQTENNAVTINLFNQDIGETLSICDCSQEETGSVEATGTYPIQGRTIWVRSNSTLNIFGGTYIGAESTSVGGGTLAVQSGGTINFYGGTVKGGTSTVAGGNVMVNGTFNFYGGTIEGGKATGKANGGNVFVAGTFNFYDGLIQGGSAGGNGGNLYFDTNAEVTIERALIQNGHSDGLGGNMYERAKSLAVKDTVISGGSSKDYGGNICISSTANTVFNGVTVKEGISQKGDSSANIYINNGSAEVTLQDTVIESGFEFRSAKSLVLSGNTVIGSDEKTGLTIVNGSAERSVTAGELGDEAKIYITAEKTGILVKNGAPYLNRFVQTKGEEYELLANENDIELAEKGEHEHLVSGGLIENGYELPDGTVHTDSEQIFTEWTSTSTLPVYSDLKVGDNYFYLSNDITLTSEWRIGKDNETNTFMEDMDGRNIFLCLNGHTVTVGSKLFISTLAAKSGTTNVHTKNVHITVTDCKETPGSVKVSSKGGTLPAFAWINGTGAELSFYNVTLDATGFEASGNGSMFRIAAQNLVKVYGATLIGGTVSGNGGVYVASNADFIMYGGTIDGGAAAMGGTIYAAGRVKLYNAVIQNGSSTSHGGNLYFDTNAEVEILDCTIRDGYSVGLGGNMYERAKSLTVRDTVISGGSSKDFGGNICFSATANTVFTGVTIKEGASQKGDSSANAYVNSGSATVTLTDCTVDSGFEYRNANLVKLTGSTVIGTDTKPGLYIHSTGAYTIDVGELGPEAKISLTANRLGGLLKNAKDVMDSVNYIESSVTGTPTVEGDDLFLR